jgi:hypothetical protein
VPLVVGERSESDCGSALVEVVGVVDRLGLQRSGAVRAFPELGAVTLGAAFRAQHPVGQVGQMGGIGLAVVDGIAE